MNFASSSHDMVSKLLLPSAAKAMVFLRENLVFSLVELENGDCKTESRSDNTVGSPHRIEIVKGDEKVTEVIDIENWQIDNSWIMRRIVSLFEWNSSVSSTKSSIQSNGYDKKGTKSKQYRTKPSTKRKAWKSQQSKVNKKSNPTKSKPRKPKSQSNSSSNPTPSTNPNPKRRNHRRSKQRIKEFNLDELSPPIVTMADQRTMAQLLQAPTEGYEDAIVVPAITANNFELKYDQDSLNSATGGNFLDKMPRECLAIIESKSKVRYSHNKPVVAKVSTNNSTSGISPDVAELKDMVKALLLDKKGQNQSPDPVKAVEESCVTCGGAHSYLNYPATDGNVYRDNIQEFISQAFAVNYNQGNTSYRPSMMSKHAKSIDQSDRFDTKFVNSNSASTSSSGTLPSNIIANPRGDLKAITTRSGVSYDGSQLPSLPSFLPKVVEDEPEATKDTVNPTNNESTEDVQPQVVQSKSPILTSEPITSLISEPVIAPVSAPKHKPKSLIPYPSRRNDEKNREKANNQIKKSYQIFKDMSFEISFADALIIMPKFASTLKALIRNKEKLSEMAQTPLNEHCSAVLLKKLHEKLGDPGKFLIPCDFPGMAECLAMADLGASINLKPFSVWKRLSLPDLTPMCMNLELVDRLISRPVGVAEDVYEIFLKTKRSLIDVFEGELTLHVGKEAITFNLDHTSRYSANYSDMTAKRIDVIDMVCEEYSQKVLGFSDTISSGNPTSYYEPIVSMASLTLTPLGNSDFLLEEVDAFLAIEDDPTSLEFYQPYHDPEGDILLLEAFLNDDPSLPPPNQGKYLPEVRKELKIYEAKYDKSSIDEPLEVELKDLPPHLEYAFLEGDNKLPVIIIKDLCVEEKTALITVLKSHKRAIAWKLSDIKGIDPEFCTHKILMEEDFKPAVQHQRKINPKIHDVIKQEVIKLLDAGLVYPISDSLWVSPVHCVPKKGGFTVVENKDNELILTRLVTGWREKSHFMVKEGIVLGHKISKQRIEIGKAKVDVITKLPHPTTVKGIRSFLGHAGFYRRLIKDFSKIARPMTRLLEKETPFIFSKECIEAFQTLKRKLTEALILIAPDWDMPFELMCDASDFAIGAVLGQRQENISSQYTMPSSEGVYQAKKPLKFSRLATIDPQEVTMAQITQPALKRANFDLKTAGDHRKVQINELNELRDQAYEKSLIYKEKTKRLHDSKIKNRVFNIGDRVYPYGTIELSQPDGPNFKVNGHRLKHYFGEDVPNLLKSIRTHQSSGSLDFDVLIV
nr:reverse transcriptase domain-containing protein [Tanacetum cinerariifolium]